jgi:benzoyl-CoA-dihydrodiol lyase
MAEPAHQEPIAAALASVSFQTHPDRYRHWKLSFAGPVATLAMQVDEDGALRPGYKLKLNSYDLGVDIELHDALQRIRFEHPQVRSVMLTSARDRIFCSGANIFMLGSSSHAWKVNFCKFTNETRNGIEDSSRYSGLKFLAACNGTTAGGGYELALACDEIWLVDDSSSAVSLPEVPLLGVLPGTGGLTRITDKRKVRRDHADIFCTLVEGVRAQRAKEWRLIDHFEKTHQFPVAVRQRALELAALSDRPADAQGVALTPLAKVADESGYHYSHVDAQVDRKARTATITIAAPSGTQPEQLGAILQAGAAWWPLAAARQLDDAILTLRTNELDIGTWIFKTTGEVSRMLEMDRVLMQFADHWFVREVLGAWRRTLARLDVTSRTLIALVDRGSCFAGTLLETALAADRVYMRSAPSDSQEPRIALSELNFGSYPTVAEVGRVHARFYGERSAVANVRNAVRVQLSPAAAVELGLVTGTPDDIDWDDEIRIAMEERTSLSPDALTGLEANLRFGPGETMQTRIFGRLSAWQNWIFIRPNAVGEAGALKVFGAGKKARFDWGRV